MSIARQYETDVNLRIRMQTHEHHTQGAALEPAVDAAVCLGPKDDLLDVGTGPGEYPNRLSRQGLRVASVYRGRLVGVDTSEGMIARARAAGTDVEFRVADAQALPFRDGSFDVVTARHMLYHVADVDRALREMHRVLRPGGRLVVVTNAAGYMAEFWDVVATAVGREAGFGALMEQRGSRRFDEVEAAERIGAVFGEVETLFVDSALVFDSAGPVVRYLESCRTICEATEDQWRAMVLRFGEEVERIVEKGVWRVSKRVAILRARRRSAATGEEPSI